MHISRLDPKDVGKMLVSLAAIGDALEALQIPALKSFEEMLEHLDGTSFASLKTNQALATSLRRLAKRLNRRFLCPVCQRPASIGCSRVGNSVYGVFRFHHYLENRESLVCSWRTTLPKLILVSADE